jgi:hypothetical protein
VIALDSMRDVATHPRRNDVIATRWGVRVVSGVSDRHVNHVPLGGSSAPCRDTRETWASVVRSGAVLLTAEQIEAARARLEVSDG